MSSVLSGQRVLSGMRPTGRLHLGHYHGVIKNWIKLQHQYECFFFAADWHALTTHYDDVSVIERSVWDMVIDWLAAGLNPQACTVFLQSRVPEHAELTILLSMITPLGWLERVPTYKDQIEALKEKDLATYGFLGYPLMQSADILVYKAGLVPVGEDQVSHIELTREVARRFNYLYGKQPDGDSKVILPEPKVLLTPAAKMPGLDGQKMSKSYNNTITLREAPEDVEKKIRTMPTDPARVRRTDAGDPSKCPVYQLHTVYSDEDCKTWVREGCTSAGIGCIDCKKPIIDAVKKELQPIQERAKEYAANGNLIRSIVDEGCERARNQARQTLKDVREAMGLEYR